MARQNFIGFTAVICVFQLSLGIALLICELVRLTFGPDLSYFIGAYIAGIPIILAGIVSLVIFMKARALDVNDRHAVKTISCLIALEIVLGIASLLGCVVGCLFVLHHGFGRHCYYYKGGHRLCIEDDVKGRLNAVIAIGFIIAASFVSFLVTICDCACKRHFGVYFCRRPRRSEAAHVITYPTSVAPPIGVDLSYKYCPTNVLPQQHGPHSHGSRVQELEEENRLLQEQIRLQREQLELQQQFHGQVGCGSSVAIPRYTPPPPSYDECTTDESAIQLLEEQNKELHLRCMEQHNELQDYDIKCTPSAPPEP